MQFALKYSSRRWPGPEETAKNALPGNGEGVFFGRVCRMRDPVSEVLPLRHRIAHCVPLARGRMAAWARAC